MITFECPCCGEITVYEPKSLALPKKLAVEINSSAILIIVCKYFDIHPRDIIKKNNKRTIADIRNLFFFLSRKYTLDTFKTIGDLVNRDHTTVISGARETANLIKTNHPTALHVKELEKYIDEHHTKKNLKAA